MGDDLFNNPRETAARLACCLAKLNRRTNLDEVTVIDLIATYMKHFHLGDKNLHGDSPYIDQEYEARRERVKKGLALLVRAGYVDSDFTASWYQPKDECTTYSQSFHGSYIRDYRESVDAVLSNDLHHIAFAVARMEPRYE